MKVLFAVSNDKMSESIVKQYEKQYKEIISYKNVYYFNAILKELQRDKTYDRVVISEDLEQYVNNDFEQMDNFIFGRLDSISDEASNSRGEDIPIILICEERRVKGEEILVKLFGIGIYNAILGNDRSINEVCRLINRPRSKKEAKIYYKIDSENVYYEKNDENDVSELELQNILTHYEKIGNDEQKIVDSFDSIAAQYNNIQLKVICKCLPANVINVLERNSSRYAELFSFRSGIANDMRIDNREAKTIKKGKKAQKSNEMQEQGTSEIMLGEAANTMMSEPVVIPSAMSSNTKRVIKEVSTVDAPIMPLKQENDEIETSNIETNELENINDDDEDKIEEEIEQPVKRGRGRPRKVVTEPVEQLPKRRRGRPRKNENIDEQANDAVLPGFEKEEKEEKTLPGLEMDNQEETILPGFEEQSNEEETVLPGFFDENDDKKEEQEFFANNSNEIENNNISQKEDMTQNFENNSRYFTDNVQKVNQYEELDIDKLLASNQKIVSFVGTSKNGTSFLVNNVAEILAMNNVNTAILDLTQNRNAYYIYTQNDENLRIRSNECINKLIQGETQGIEVRKNLTVYTSAFDVEEIENVEPIIETLLNKHSIILLDCDFETPDRYFKYSQEIYLVQSMDILTIQPLTLFLKKLSDKGSFSEEKVRVVLNKYIKTKEINENLLIGGISIYNDAAMSNRKELFDRKTVKRITIPFELDTYLRYLNGLVVCDISLKGYSKKLVQSLKQLATYVYSTSSTSKNNNKYTPPSINNRNSTFSPSMNSTLEQMSKRY
ncbi:MAG: hypothetical protein BHV99_00105 [Clostridium sp. 26_21]|nr:MAG: hypothetical protein BHV99_00105 [Clostridium sp. 26_21]